MYMFFFGSPTVAYQTLGDLINIAKSIILKEKLRVHVLNFFVFKSNPESWSKDFFQ